MGLSTKIKFKNKIRHLYRSSLTASITECYKYLYILVYNEHFPPTAISSHQWCMEEQRVGIYNTSLCSGYDAIAGMTFGIFLYLEIIGWDPTEVDMI